MSLHTAMLVGLLAPLVVAILTPFLAVRHVWRDAAVPIGGVSTFIAAVHVALAVLDGETPRLFVAQIAEGLALEFAVTPLGAIFGLVASGLWILAALYSVGYMRGNHEKHQTRFAAFYAVAVHAAMAVAWSGNLLVLFVFYEILTFSTYPLVTHKESALARNAGRLYMSILVGTSVVLLLPAVVWVWLSTGTLDFRPGGYLAGQIDPAMAPILLALFAFGVGKAALMPIHRWLPAAMVAPTPVSALLHAVAVVKAGVFTILTVVVMCLVLIFCLKLGRRIGLSGSRPLPFWRQAWLPSPKMISRLVSPIQRSASYPILFWGRRLRHQLLFRAQPCISLCMRLAKSRCFSVPVRSMFRRI